ncbi:MAG TPA: NUDIX hydrolase, partial [Erysipelotrichaceae bacterium]|nr:NUDIX hydrolase [Erysipelotrichaceae bacterium]
IGKETLEIPAGKLEYGENPMECGLRELNEETGMACDKLELLLSFVSTPGFCDERIWIYKAINPKKADIKLSLDEDEEIDTLWLDLETAFEYTRNGKIDDGKTVIAISQMMAERN